MLADLDASQLALAETMSEISEATWHAGWMEGLEYALWQAIESGPCLYGHGKLTQPLLDELKRLAAACGGWIVFDDEREETFVPMAQWRIEWPTRPAR